MEKSLTVQELIDVLQKVEDKSTPVWGYSENDEGLFPIVAKQIQGAFNHSYCQGYDPYFEGGIYAEQNILVLSDENFKTEIAKPDMDEPSASDLSEYPYNGLVYRDNK